MAESLRATALTDHLPVPAAQLVVAHQETWDLIRSALAAQGLYLFPIPHDEDDLPTYGVGFSRG